MNGHAYPAGYDPKQPDQRWSFIAAWEVMDMLTPGAISDPARDLLAGMIAGKLDAERERCAGIALAMDSCRGNEKHIAKAIREGQ